MNESKTSKTNKLHQRTASLTNFNKKSIAYKYCNLGLKN